MDKKIRLFWWGILGILLIAAFVKFLLPVHSSEVIEQTAADNEIVVYITGAVNHPGLLHLPIDARLDDALKKAELTPDADLESLNPAQKLKDGQKIIVSYTAQSTGEDSISGNTAISGSAVTTAVKGQTTRVNINKAGMNELDTIPGVGPALAQRIIDYRTQNGSFSSPEEIQNVSGIGAKTYEKMAGYISVGP